MTSYTNNAAHNGAFIVYINGIEVPCKSVTLRYGVWQIPEMQLEMVADPVLTRLGFEDRIQVQVFYLDDTGVVPAVKPEFRLFGEGEITGWGYQNTPSGRSIMLTCSNQFAIFTQLFVQFLTQLDDMTGHYTDPNQGSATIANPSSQIVFPFSLFQNGLIPSDPTSLSPTDGAVKRPFDFMYNCVKNMIGAQVPASQRTIPAVNFFTRWARLTNFHNRFAAMPFFDEAADKNIFPILKALQTTSAVDVLSNNLIPQVQNTGSIMDMLQLVYSTMFMEIAMIPSMPLVTVDLTTSLVDTTTFEGRNLVLGSGEDAKKYVAAKPAEALKPNRIQNYFTKPQFLFGLPPTCNVFFPSQIKMLSYSENFATQPTRLYFDDEVMQRLYKGNKDGSGLNQVVKNVLAVAYPPEADLLNKARVENNAKVNGKNFLIFPEEFFKGPVMDRRPAPPWMYFLKQHEGTQKAAEDATQPTSDTTAPASPPKIRLSPGAVMVTSARIGRDVNGKRTFSKGIEAIRSLVTEMANANGIPPEFLLAWAEHESGGKWSVITKLNERGYFQIMGPHPNQSASISGTEAGSIGLSHEQHVALSGRFDAAGKPIEPTAAEKRFMVQAGVKLAKRYRTLGDSLLTDNGINAWSEADHWRMAKLFHGGPGFAKDIVHKAKRALGRPPASWADMYNAAAPACTPVELKVLNNATGVGSVIEGASGTTVDSTSANGRPTVIPASPPSTNTQDIDPALFAKLREDSPSVYELYAEYEYFRERYSRRSGTVSLAFNPYVVPGFPMALFDNRSTRVDLFAYITAVTQTLSHRGNDTQVQFSYGRTIQEAFELMSTEFAQGASAAGAAPREPIRDIRKVVQGFEESEELYQRLFFGGQKLYGKDASCDWRTVIGYAPTVPSDPPVTIFVEGVPEAQKDRVADAADTLVATQPKYDELRHTIEALRLEESAARQVIADLAEQYVSQSMPTADQQKYDSAIDTVTRIVTQLNTLEPQLAAMQSEIQRATAVASDPTAFAAGQVVHNLDGSREIVPLPGAADLFNNYDSAQRYNWRPICTLDEYVTFHNSVGENAIPAFGHPRSVGARYYDRIRRLTPLTDDTVLPVGADGLTPTVQANPAAAQGSSDTTPEAPATGEANVSVPAQGVQVPSTTGKVPAISSGTGPHGQNSATDFPQVRAEWDKILLAYRNNVLNTKAPLK
jgi:hypothetical protein